MAALAWRSAAWPLALSGGPAILVGLLGHNPLPAGAITFGLAAWMVLGVALAVVRGGAFAPRALLAAPFLATAVLLILLIVGEGPSDAPAYASVKVKLFIAANVISLVAGLVVGRSRRDFDLFLLLSLIVGAVTSVALVRGLTTGTQAANVGGRFSLNEQASPIGLGRAAAEAILIGTSILLASRSPFRRLLAFGALPLIAVSFIAAGSRGPVLGLLVGIVVLLGMTLRDRRTRQRSVLLALAVVAGALLVSQLVPNNDVQRSLSVLTGSGEGLSSNGRSQLWGAAESAFQAHPLTGVGTGGFASIRPLDVYPHNLFLEVAAELGILGLIPLVVMLMAAMAAVVRGYRAAPVDERAHVAVAAALFLAAFVNAQVSGDIGTNSGLWLSIGLIYGITSRYGATRSRALSQLRLQRTPRLDLGSR